MKKNLITLMIAAGVTVSASGVAHAYNSSFSGDSISLGGTVATPVESVYEGKVASLTGLDATIQVGLSSTTIAAPAHAGLLALRSIDGGFDNSATNKIANITFNGQKLSQAASVDRFTNGKIEMTLEARDSSSNTRIGDVVFPIQAAGVSVIVNKNTNDAIGESLFAYDASSAFFGGLPEKSDVAIQTYAEARSAIDNLFSDVTDYLPVTTSEGHTASSKSFTADGMLFNAAYAVGIAAGDNIVLNLDSPAQAGSVAWTASIPVVVTYK
ncbi:hypothetical protein BMM44_004568 [Escherichia coli]|nr:hypothetical protein [Escherichia coli]EEQ9845931.1 hypothetical protein [Escherichia coli]EER1049818.1 hypothetical protein [Escherichia coli]EEY6729406.1 hypothetical protein [Escherichia coli]EFG4289564.1 hypothetical protein [Escherichia coli]